MLNVVFSSNDEYSPLLTVALASLLENNCKDFDFINVFILDNGIEKANRDRVLRMCEKYPCRATFIDGSVIESLDISVVPMECSSIAPESFANFSRLFVSTLLPDDVDKVIYLDCDGLVLGSLRQLWDSDISDYYCAGVLQSGINEPLKKEFWFFDVDKYINSGFLYINLEKWRRDDVEARFIEFLTDHQGQYFCSDQGVINSVFDGKIRVIEPKYNLISSYRDFNFILAKKIKSPVVDEYSKQTIKESSKNPIFVHFAGREKAPWLDCRNEYFSEFERYAKMTGCESIIQYGSMVTSESSKSHGFLKKIWGSISKVAIFFTPSRYLISRNAEEGIKMFKREELRISEDDD